MLQTTCHKNFMKDPAALFFNIAFNIPLIKCTISRCQILGYCYRQLFQYQSNLYRCFKCVTNLRYSFPVKGTVMQISKLCEMLSSNFQECLFLSKQHICMTDHFLKSALYLDNPGQNILEHKRNLQILQFQLPSP